MAHHHTPPFPHLWQPFHRLASLLQPSLYHQVYLVCGPAKAGKKTLIHYLMGKALESLIDDDGQQVLGIQEQAERTIILEDMLVVYPDEEEKILYMSINGLRWDSLTAENQVKWNITFCYLCQLLIGSQLPVKFLLILDFNETSQNEPFLKFYANFSLFDRFFDRTAFIISKVSDVDEKNEFIQIQAPDLIETNSELTFIQSLIDSEQIYAISSQEPDQQARQQMVSGLKKIKTDTLRESTENSIPQYLKSCLINHESADMQGLTTSVMSYLSHIPVIMGASIGMTLKAFAGVAAEQQEHNLFTKTAKGIFEFEDIRFEVEGQAVKSSEQRQKFFQFYEECWEKLSKSGPNSVFNFLLEQVSFVAQYWSKTPQLINLLQIISLYQTISQSLHQRPKEEDIFAQQVQACDFLSDSYLSKVFEKVKKHFSQPFIEASQSRMKSPNKSKVKRAVKRPQFPTYEDQKKQMAGKSLSQKLGLLSSPLKIDLMLDELKARSKSSSRTIKEEKIIIKMICSMLEMYGEVESAIRLASVVPNFNLMEFYLNSSLVPSLDKNSPMLPQAEFREKLQFVQEIVSFFKNNNKATVYNLAKAEKLIQDNKQKPGPQQQPNPPQKSAFMNYQLAQKLFQTQQALITRCIETEARNWDVCVRYILIEGLNTKLCAPPSA